jgi:hypothetical protein
MIREKDAPTGFKIPHSLTSPDAPFGTSSSPMMWHAKYEANAGGTAFPICRNL